MISITSRAVAALAVAAFAALAVSEAQAQPIIVQPPASAFGLQFNWGGNEDSYEPRGPALAICFTDRQIRNAIAGRGYTDIALNVPNDERVQVRATMDGLVYLLEYNFCNDTIEDREVLRPAGQ
jgi:hypothetical protein